VGPKGQALSLVEWVADYWTFSELDFCYFCFWLDVLVLSRREGYNTYCSKDEEKHLIEAMLFAVQRQE
jgi:hypothetical protein